MNIELININKSFGKQHIIHDLTMTIRSGDIFGLLGPSGSGKTTTIRLLIGAIAADSGNISFDDIKIPNLDLLKRIGFMPQNDALYDDLSGEDNLKFFGELYGVKKMDLANRIDEVLQIVELTDYKKMHVAHYSGGMKKRLSLAAALIQEPEVLLLDEPTVGIDPVLRRSIWNKFKDMKKAGKTLIISTHVMDEVYECDKAALLYNGKLINYDTVQNLLDKTENGKIDELFFMASKKFGVTSDLPVPEGSVTV